MRLTIVSGGQAGADRGAMDAAIRLALDYGGWAPAGFRAEDGTIPAIYASKMRESSSSDYGMRTRLNVQDSDATLIVSYEAELTGGSAYTAKAARQQRKPCKHLVLPQGKGRVPEEVRSALLSWLAANHVATINVAGPRESREPGLQIAVRDTLVWLLEDVAVEQLADLSATLAMLSSAIDSDQPAEPRPMFEGTQPTEPVEEFLSDLENAPLPLVRKDVDRLADLLLTLTDQQLRDWLGPSYCGRCCQDILANPQDPNGCLCPEGPLT